MMNIRFDITCEEDWEKIPKDVTVLFVGCDSYYAETLYPIPEGVKYLHCTGMRLERITSIPSTLISLDCAYNEIKVLPELHEGLKYLDCRCNPLESVPALPKSLVSLDCRGCGLTKLPLLSHTRIKFLDCDNNRIDWIPKLPDTIRRLELKNNMLEVLPKIGRKVDIDYYFNPLLDVYYDYDSKYRHAKVKPIDDIIENLNDMARLTILKKMLTKINKIFFNNKIRVVQSLWKNYWYKPFTLDGYDYPVSRYMLCHIKDLGL